MLSIVNPILLIATGLYMNTSCASTLDNPMSSDLGNQSKMNQARAEKETLTKKFPMIYPRPHQITQKEEWFSIPGAFKVETQYQDVAIRKLIDTIENKFTVKDKVFPLKWEINSALKFNQGKAFSGTYQLDIKKSGISIIANDNTGVFYALKTLSQLIVIEKSNSFLPICSIKDYPDVEFRGTVEGFYGTPWSHKSRLSQIQFYGDYKMNTYIYGPKNDPFHGFSNRWREPYPADQAEKMKELVQFAKLNKVNFVWAVHPGANIFWHDKDGDGVTDDFVNCRKKFEMMYDLGVRSFALFFDDIGGEGARPEKQSEMLNYLNKEFVKAKGDVTPLIFCPTAYSGFNKNYMEVLGNKLDQDVRVMWTGRGICVDIRSEDVARINKLMNRNVFVWWNWPVSDYCRTQLLIGPCYGNSLDNAPMLSGFTSNPMDKPEASKIPLFGVADYTWNMKSFDSDKSWKDGIKMLFPTVAQSMQVFANHNCDQGPNGHGYRRVSSVEILPTIDEAKKQMKENGKLDKKTYDALIKEFNAMSVAGKELKEKLPKINPELYAEIECWIEAFTILGMEGEKIIQLGKITEAKQKFNVICQILADQEKREIISNLQKEKGKPDQWARGCLPGIRVITPFINEMLQIESKNVYQALTGNQLKNKSQENLYKAFSNVPTLSNILAERKGKFVNLKQILEVIKLEPGQYIGLELPPGIVANYVHLKLDNPKASQLGIVEISKDNKKWEKLNTRNNGQELQNGIDIKKGIRWMRFINKSNETLEIKTKMFKFDIPENSKINSIDALFDADLGSSFTFMEKKTIEAPANTQSVIIVTPINNQDFQFEVNTQKGKVSSKYLKNARMDNIELTFKNGSTMKYIDYIEKGNSTPVKSILFNGQKEDPINVFEVIWK